MFNPCQNSALPGDPDGFCILHSQDKAKDPAAFKTAILDLWNQEDSKSYNFSGVFFPGSFDLDFFRDRKFEKTAYFIRATFAEWADFSGVIFTERANFSEAFFGNKAIFHKATFNEAADFSWTTFNDGAIFKDAVFIKEAVFSMAAFNGWTQFEATFKEVALFSQAKFNIETYFSKSIFTKGADFSIATFKGETHFNECIFIEDAVLNFIKTNISGLVLIWAINHPEYDGQQKSFNGEFQNLIVSPGGLLRFKDLYLDHSIFEWSDLRPVEFHNVQWYLYRGRQAIYDEVLLRKDEKKKPWFWTWLSRYAPYADPPSPWPDRYGEVERLYRDLQKNYEKARDYKKMGDFHYGEMEMHRRASKWRWFPFYWYNLYWFLSGYGERPSRALGWLVVFLVGLAGLVWGLGLEVANPPHIAGFGDSFIYLLQKATLQRPTWAEPVGFWGKLVAGLSVLLIPGQAALFLLALRNRLGRRR